MRILTRSDRVRGGFIKSRGNRWLVHPATALLPAIRGKAYRRPRCARIWQAAFYSRMRPVLIGLTGVRSGRQGRESSEVKSLYRQLPVYGRLTYPVRAEATKHDMIKASRERFSEITSGRSVGQQRLEDDLPRLLQRGKIEIERPLRLAHESVSCPRQV
jgi:hypothetical protein